VPRSNGLLAFYFGKGGRNVTICAGEREFEAGLSTRYERNARTWHIVLATAGPEMLAARTEAREMALAS
jgi:hypothetical protein